jgi:hypothetical protein
MQAMGDVDELNSCIGVAREFTSEQDEDVAGQVGLTSWHATCISIWLTQYTTGQGRFSRAGRSAMQALPVSALGGIDHP